MRAVTRLLTSMQLCWLVGTGCSGTDPSMDAYVDGSAQVDASGDGSVGALSVDLQPAADGYPGGLSLLLAQVTAPDGVAVDLSVATTPTIMGEVVPQRIVGGGVVELLLRPTAAQMGQMVSVELTATAGADQATDSVGLGVIEYSDVGQRAQGDMMLAVFLEYLEANRSDLGLSSATTWTESWNSEPVLIVTHRSYLSESWELHVAWHNTIAPDDWSYVTLRRRNQLVPELAFCFPSQSGDRTVRAANLSDPRTPCAM